MDGGADDGRGDLGVHPAGWPGSCFWDLVGARRLPGFDPSALLRELPRLDEGRFWRAVGLERGAPRPVEAVVALGVSASWFAACDALACDPAHRTPDAVDARAVVTRLALEADLRPRRVALDLGVSERGVRDLAHRAVAESTQAAIHAQLDLRVRLTHAATVQPNESERRSIHRSRVLAGDHPPR